MLVLAAVQQNGFTLQHASQELHASKTVLRPLIRQDMHRSLPLRSSASSLPVFASAHPTGHTLQHASPEIHPYLTYHTINAPTH
mgnify:CR=1 FL=1